jgi:S1-C subfamily serine protease
MNRIIFKTMVMLILAFPCLEVFAQPDLTDLLPTERNTVEIFQKFSPKVVYIHRLSTVMNRSHKKMQVPVGAGSGIIWDDKGHIVTNYHVIKGADSLAVTIDKLTVPAKLIGSEPRKDLAVLSIKDPKVLAGLKSYTPFMIAHTKDLFVGQKTIAIGNPFGFDHSLTVGVISALGRQVPGVAGVTIRHMIQTDASVNPGNSGGPLLDSKGKLIGLNTTIYSKSGNSAGVGFAVPADDIERIVPQLINNGKVALSGLGVHRVEDNIASRLGVRKGVLIEKVLPKTPAAKLKWRGTFRDQWGRFHLGDVIVALNKHPVTSYDALYNLLLDVKVGESVTVTIDRHGEKKNYKMKTINIASL